MPETVLIDESILQVQFDGDQTTVQSILRAFADCTEDYQRDVQLALDVRNLEGLQAIAHKVKSASYSIGAKKLGDSCSLLEDTARAGQAERAWVLAGQVLAQLLEAKGYIYQRLL